MDIENILKDMYSNLNNYHDFILGPVDTDSISICKQDGSSFSIHEQEALINEINSVLPKFIVFANDGYFSKLVILKAKNYILYDGKKIKKKGSSLKSSKIEKGLLDLMNQIIECLVFDRQNEILSIYNKFIKEVHNLQDINRWTKKLTVTDKILNPERKNELKPFEAIQGKGLQMGDKFWVYATNDDKLKLAEQWSNDHNIEHLMKRIYDTMVIFKNVIDINEITKYHLKNKLIKEKLNKLLEFKVD